MVGSLNQCQNDTWKAESVLVLGAAWGHGDHHCVGQYGLLLSQDGQAELRLPRGHVPQLFRFTIKPIGMERLGSG